MTPAVIALLVVVVLPLVLLAGDLVVRRNATTDVPAGQPARLPVDLVAAPSPAAFSTAGSPGMIKPGQGMVYRGPVAARR